MSITLQVRKCPLGPFTLRDGNAPRVHLSFGLESTRQVHLPFGLEMPFWVHYPSSRKVPVGSIYPLG